MKTYRCDFLIIGSGLAGLAFALKVAPHGKVILVTKSELPKANSSMAQGGIAAVTSEEDSFESHISDTHIAGAGLCRDEVVRNFVQQAPDRIQDLIDWGVQFDETLTREGGHSFRRILHHEDQTGMYVHNKLLDLVKKNPQIQIYEHHFAIDLILNKKIWPYEMGPTEVLGTYALSLKSDEVVSFISPHTILATGGAGKAYLYTSNWEGATGDGIAMAYRAGARIANMEFMQFHPTCLYHPEARNFLLTEALRGEGGELINGKGEAFMKKQHPLGSLAPRDIVARGIDAEIKSSGAECVYLDMRKHNREYLENRFPAIFQKCLQYGWDMSQNPIPVVPAAHYLCGGVLSDENGKSDINGLWVLGETACTGFHGANRLASNSLLECLTTAHNASQSILKNHSQCTLQHKEFFKNEEIQVPEWELPSGYNPDELVVITHMWDEIRRLMWNYVGIVRSTKRLERAQHRLENILTEVREYYSHLKLSSDILELRNIAIVAQLTVKCALKRKESRGIHFTLDYPPKSIPMSDLENKLKYKEQTKFKATKTKAESLNKTIDHHQDREDGAKDSIIIRGL